MKQKRETVHKLWTPSFLFCIGLFLFVVVVSAIRDRTPSALSVVLGFSAAVVCWIGSALFLWLHFQEKRDNAELEAENHSPPQDQ